MHTLSKWWLWLSRIQLLFLIHDCKRFESNVTSADESGIPYNTSISYTARLQGDMGKFKFTKLSNSP